MDTDCSRRGEFVAPRALEEEAQDARSWLAMAFFFVRRRSWVARFGNTLDLECVAIGNLRVEYNV
jgi:hypothetical protein